MPGGGILIVDTTRVSSTRCQPRCWPPVICCWIKPASQGARRDLTTRATSLQIVTILRCRGTRGEILHHRVDPLLHL